MTAYALHLISKLEARQNRISGLWQNPEEVLPVEIVSDNGSEILAKTPDGQIYPWNRAVFLRRFHKQSL